MHKIRVIMGREKGTKKLNKGHNFPGYKGKVNGNKCGCYKNVKYS